MPIEPFLASRPDAQPGDQPTDLPLRARRRQRVLDLSLDPLPRSSQAEAAASDDPTPTILTVCTGNICRSPMAEVLLRAQLAPMGVRVHSAGTRAPVGSPMTELALEFAERHGSDAASAAAHRARFLMPPMVDQADLVLTMTREHRSDAVQLSPPRLRQVFTVREFARLAEGLSDAEIRHIADTAATARGRLAAVALAVAGRRGTVFPDAPEDDDVIDPYRRSREVYELSTSQLIPALEVVARVVRAALA